MTDITKADEILGDIADLIYDAQNAGDFNADELLGQIKDVIEGKPRAKAPKPGQRTFCADIVIGINGTDPRNYAKNDSDGLVSVANMTAGKRYRLDFNNAGPDGSFIGMLVGLRWEPKDWSVWIQLVNGNGMTVGFNELGIDTIIELTDDPGNDHPLLR